MPGILVTPICPHTLSFRPLFLPDSAELHIYNPPQSRQSAWISADGRGRIELKQGEALHIGASQWSVPSICRSDPSVDLFDSLSRCLNWNVREPQKPLYAHTGHQQVSDPPPESVSNGQPGSVDRKSLQKLKKKLSQNSLSRVGSIPPASNLFHAQPHLILSSCIFLSLSLSL